MKLSIIIPTIGRETLSAVLEGIKRCTDYESIQPEILVVFDGKEILRSAGDDITIWEDRGVKFLETGKKVYAGGARNFGLDQATGEVIVFLQDDTIPTESWLQKIYKFHVLHPQKESVLLGKVSWTGELSKDPFHQWLLDHGQFAFGLLEKDHPLSTINHKPFRFFYTSNISVKRSLIESERFSDQFQGWGFEDIEFGYRLQKKGMELFYDASCKVLHDHPQTLEGFCQNTCSAKKNALIFESLHPEIKIRPRGVKLWILKFGIWILKPFVSLDKRWLWWWEWKKSWI